MHIRRLAWAGVEITSGPTNLVVDLLENARPLGALLGAPRTAIVPASEELDLALITHLHPDHYDPETLRQKLKPTAKVLCDRANAAKVASDGFDTVAADIHAPISIGPFTITALPAVDGFGDPQISFLIEAEGRKVVHCGDTLWHGHWWKIRAKYGFPDLAFLPINGAVTEFPGMKPSGLAADLTPVQAAAAASLLEPKLCVPIHYGTFNNPPVYAEQPDAERTFLEAAQRAEVAAQVIEPGGGVPLPERTNGALLPQVEQAETR